MEDEGTGCLRCGLDCLDGECETYGNAPEPPSRWELYSCEGLDCELQPWADLANDCGFAWGRFFTRWYQGSDLVHQMSIRASPLLTFIRA